MSKKRRESRNESIEKCFDPFFQSECSFKAIESWASIQFSINTTAKTVFVVWDTLLQFLPGGSLGAIDSRLSQSRAWCAHTFLTKVNV